VFFFLATDFLNFTYATNPCASNVPVAAVMRKGRFSYFDPKMGAGFDLHVASVKEGSLQPGTRHAVVVIACDFPVGGTAAAYLFAEHGRGATLLGRVGAANWGPDWGRGPDSIGVRFAKNLLHVDDCKDPACTTMAATKYALRRGALTRLGTVMIKTTSSSSRAHRGRSLEL